MALCRYVALEVSVQVFLTEIYILLKHLCIALSISVIYQLSRRMLALLQESVSHPVFVGFHAKFEKKNFFASELKIFSRMTYISKYISILSIFFSYKRNLRRLIVNIISKFILCKTKYFALSCKQSLCDLIVSVALHIILFCKYIPNILYYRVQCVKDGLL